MPLLCGNGTPSFCWNATGCGFEAASSKDADTINAWLKKNFTEKEDAATLVRCLVEAFEFFGGVPEHVLFDNAKTVVIEEPYTGPYLLAGFSSLKAPRRWLGPERGFEVSQEAYGNLEGEDFVILSEALLAAVPLPGPSILRLEARGRAGIGGPPGLVISGASDRYDYLPLDGIYTAGYPDPVRGEAVLDLKAQLWVPVLTPDRGVRAFPLFLQGVALGGFACGGVLFSDRESLPSMQRPGKYLRTSLGVELKAGLLAGYEFPVELLGGYQWAFSDGGRDGFYWTVKLDRCF